MRDPTKPLREKHKRVRQRQRADGTWRIWWEPERAVQVLGFSSVELDATRPTWSKRRAEELNDKVDRARLGEPTDTPKAGGRTVFALVREFRQSRRWKRLKPASQKSYSWHLRMIEDKWGPQPAAHFTKPIMQAWYETMYTHRGATLATRAIATMSILMETAERLGWRPENSNPCLRLDKDALPSRKRVATWAEIWAIDASAAELGIPSVGLAALLSTLQGQRQTDILQATLDEFSQVELPDGPAWIWHLVRSKRQTEGAMQIHPYLMERLEKTITTAKNAGRDELLACDKLGRPYDVHLFAKRWAATRAQAAKELPSVADLQFRDLRRTFGSLSRAGGASRDDASDVLGNSAAVNFQLGDTYMPPQFETASRAVLSITVPVRLSD